MFKSGQLYSANVKPLKQMSDKHCSGIQKHQKVINPEHNYRMDSTARTGTGVRLLALCSSQRSRGWLRAGPFSPARLNQENPAGKETLTQLTLTQPEEGKVVWRPHSIFQCLKEVLRSWRGTLCHELQSEDKADWVQIEKREIQVRY